MKRSILLPLGIACTVALCLSSCGNSTQVSMRQVVTGEPIMPALMGADSTHVVFTDYVPSLVKGGFDQVWIDNLNCSEYVERVDIANDMIAEPDAAPRVHLLSFNRGSDWVSVPVLPHCARQQGLYTCGADADHIYLSFKNQPAYVNWTMFWQNSCIEFEQPTAPAESGMWVLPFPAEARGHQGRSYIRIYATDSDVLYNDVLIPLQDGAVVTDASQLTRHDAQAQVLYSLMVDRFMNGNTANDAKLNDPEVLDIVDYQGGDFAGITQKIEAGFFDELGVNTLWISPITQNPWDAWGRYDFESAGTADDGTPLYKNKYDPTRPYSRFSGYHGYWPIYATRVDKRFGTDEELRTLLATAHAHQLNVILDYVANHMHINSPTLQAHPDWMTDSILPDGRRNFELWDEARLTTWFDRHIPSLDLEREDVYEPMTDSALYWLQQFDFDGFRHDACKHIPEVYWRTLTQKMKTRYPNRPLWMIGETYGSPELIGSYVKSGMLNAQFDFNVYFTAINALGDEGNMRDINRVVLESLGAYGSHHTMGNITGNHDQIRFISLAGGDLTERERYYNNGKEAGWTRDVTVGDTAKAYKVALLLHVLNLTIPGVPCIYQGDEYGQSGANDPDNRHMMRFDGYNEHETALRAEVQQLIAMRRSSLPLLYGEYIPIYADEDILAYERVYMGEKVTVALNSSDKEQDSPLGKLAPYSYRIEQAAVAHNAE
ncbi:MAG: hypothetical protein IJ581_01585 [Paludibacteraceae bacterium]|nr:hypothetical protein [Paludibacteraceae bacterium]